MADTILFNKTSHQDLKIITKFEKKFGENVGSVLAFPTEFVELQKEYPILFKLNPETNKFYASVLLGLNQDENLFLDSTTPSGWAATHIPAIIAKGPFLIGLSSNEEDGASNPVIHIDMDHKKISKTEGQPIFLEHGGNSPYLQHIIAILETLHKGMMIQDNMFDLFSEFDLIEPVNIDINLKNGETHRLVGNYTINKSKLMELNGDQLEKLNKLGFLPMAYAVITSMTNIRKLSNIKEKNDQ